MAGFMYFVPLRPAISHAEAAQLGIGPVGLQLSRHAACAKGPGETSGVIIAATAPDNKPALRYTPETQTWCPAPGKRYWVGFEKDNPPGPDELARKHMIPGFDVKLGDGLSWTVPVAIRAFEHEDEILLLPSPNLPRAYGVDAEGNETMALTRSVDPLWDAASEYWTKFYDKDAKGLKPTERLAIAATVLAANYFVGHTEVLALTLLTTETIREINDITVDREGFRQINKAIAGREASAEGNVDTSTGSSG